MPLDITFTLSDTDLGRFQAIIDKARASVSDEHTAEEIEEAARELIKETGQSDLPEFISARMTKLSVLIDMINELEEAMRGNASQTDVIAGLGEIYARISAHFALEEKIMREAAYPDLGSHKADHEQLLDQLHS